jgi:hypothetical protein
VREPLLGYAGGDGVTTEERERLRALCDKATPGPWYSDNWANEWEPQQRTPFEDAGATITRHPNGASRKREDDVVVGGNQDEQGGAVGVLRNADAAFIAAARTALPELLDECERLQVFVWEVQHARNSNALGAEELAEIDAALVAIDAWEVQE